MGYSMARGGTSAWPFGTTLLHLDVEGDELEAIRGALATLRRDRPVVTVEVHVHANHSFIRELLTTVASIDYVPRLLAEQCGRRRDCRNLVCLPSERTASAALESATVEVNSTTIFALVARSGRQGR